MKQITRVSYRRIYVVVCAQYVGKKGPWGGFINITFPANFLVSVC